MASALVHKGFMFPKEVADAINRQPNQTDFVTQAVREKLVRDERIALYDGFALLAGSPKMWDMEFPTGGQIAADALFQRAEGNAAG